MTTEEEQWARELGYQLRLRYGASQIITIHCFNRVTSLWLN